MGSTFGTKIFVCALCAFIYYSPPPPEILATPLQPPTILVNTRLPIFLLLHKKIGKPGMRLLAIRCRVVD